MSSSLESPIAAILAQANRLRLTPEQQVELRRFGLDFEMEAARLISKRCLLQIETERKHVCDGTLLGFTPEEVAAIDEQTAKLRLAWAAALNNARSILSLEQQKNLQPQVRLPPSFEWEFGEKGEDLDARVTRVISAQLKDTKVLEMETAQAITDRLLTWSKWFALAIGAPLTLGAIVLGGLGYRTYSDFTSTVSSVEERARDQINNAAAAKTREFEGRAHKLELGFNQLENKLIELQTLPEKVQNLTNRLQRLEQIEIRAPSDVSFDKTSRLQKQIEEFRAYMENIGYTIPRGKIGIRIDPSNLGAPYYDPTDNEIVIDQKLIDDPEVAYKAYTHHALEAINKPASKSENKTAKDIEYGFAAYMPCSYQGTSKYGSKFIQFYAHLLPKGTAKLGYLYDLTNDLKFVSRGERGSAKAEPDDRSQAWGGSFWEIRGALGCQPDVAQCERVDKILLTAWASPWLEGPSNTMDRRFAEGIIAAIAPSGTAREIEKVRSVFKRRELSLSP